VFLLVQRDKDLTKWLYYMLEEFKLTNTKSRPKGVVAMYKNSEMNKNIWNGCVCGLLLAACAV